MAYFQLIYRQSPRRTKQNHDKNSQYSWCPYRNTNLAHPEYKLQVLPLQPTCLASCFFLKTFSLEVIFDPQLFWNSLVKSWKYKTEKELRKEKNEMKWAATEVSHIAGSPKYH
jgi:hypothetical protein